VWSSLRLEIRIESKEQSEAKGRRVIYVCGGELAAATYSLIGSPKLSGLDPELYPALSWPGLPTVSSAHRATPALEPRPSYEPSPPGILTGSCLVT
jgi:hypothetical protein